MKHTLVILQLRWVLMRREQYNNHDELDGKLRL